MSERSAEQAEAEALALDLMHAKHPNNPDVPASMVRAGCAAPLAEALWDLGWRRQTATSAPGVAAPAESTPAPCITASGASAPTSAEVVPTAEQGEPERRCQCDPCTLPRANGGRCPSTHTQIGNVRSSHCLACAHCCFEED